MINVDSVFRAADYKITSRHVKRWAFHLQRCALPLRRLCCAIWWACSCDKDIAGIMPAIYRHLDEFLTATNYLILPLTRRHSGALLIQ